MNRFFAKAALIASGLIVCVLVSGRTAAADGYEQVADFQSDITVNLDGTITVQERITYDFGFNERRGIYREIPKIKENSEGKKYVMRFELASITDENNVPYEYASESTNQLFKVRIGNPDVYLRGQHIYIITYVVSGALEYYSDHDELFWNINGFEWQVPMQAVSATVHLPSSINTDDTQRVCYTGTYGSTAQDCTTNVDTEAQYFATTTLLPLYENLSIAVSFPIDVVAYLPAEEYKSFWDSWAGIAVIILIILAILWWYLLYPVKIAWKWFREGRDPGKGREVSAWFDPPKLGDRDLTPAETGGVIDESIDLKEISATIVHLAQRGYLKIEERKKKDFYLVKGEKVRSGQKASAEAAGPSVDSLLKFERTLYDGLFDGSTELRLKNASLVSLVEKVKKQGYEQLVSNGYFEKNPDAIRKFYLGIGVAAFCTANVLLAVACFLFGRNMPRKTMPGTEAAAVARSLKNFLTSQERQLEFQADKQMLFEKLLPYATAFGAEKIWAKRFDDLDLQPPDWYQGYDTSMFSSAILANSLSKSFSDFRSAATPTRSSSGFSSGFSSGGGFSGGGGGGGGGGSW